MPRSVVQVAEPWLPDSPYAAAALRCEVGPGGPSLLGWGSASKELSEETNVLMAEMKRLLRTVLIVLLFPGMLTRAGAQENQGRFSSSIGATRRGTLRPWTLHPERCLI